MKRVKEEGICKMDKYKWKHPILDIFKIGIKAAPGLMLIVCIQTIISALVPIVQILVVARFIDKAIQAVNNGGKAISTLLPAVIIIVLITYQWISNTLMKLLWIRFENKLRTSFTVDIVEKRAKLEYVYIEDEETWDLIKRVSSQPESKIKELFETIIKSICLVFKIVGIVGIIMVYVWWAAILLVVVAVPMFRLSIKSGKATYEVNQEITKYNRACEYLTEVVMGRDSAHERTLFHYGEFIDEKWKEHYGNSAKMLLRAYGQWYAKLEMGSIFTAIISAFNIVFLLIPTIKGIISIGMFMSLVNSCIGLIEAMSWEFRDYLDDLTNKFIYINEVKKVALLKENLNAIEERIDKTTFNSIEFIDVTFSYPNSEKKILDQVSFKIDKGGHYAIVGRNGEGKTTIIKLLSGLYAHYTGKILIDGKELREYPMSDIKGLFSIVYQDFAKYAISTKENIKLANQKATDKEIDIALETFNLKRVVDQMSQGINTPLGKIQSSGIDLSGGEWQRLALSRTFVNTAPIHLLDEPTAALDPMSECQIYNDYQKISKDKTTILISHRLGSVRLVDKILVLDKGKIVETGDHDTLMKNKQLYYEMYESQGSWYK